jgi:hypothetical protein
MKHSEGRICSNTVVAPAKCVNCALRTKNLMNMNGGVISLPCVTIAIQL